MKRTLAFLFAVVLTYLPGVPGECKAQPARSESENFVVSAHTAEFARRVGEMAEFYRRELAIEWLGEPLPGNWSMKCPITCKVGDIGAGGRTTFTINEGTVFGWRMTIQGTEERILDSVLPHEITHTIFVSHFRRPLPRWADEGASTLVEHQSERLRQAKLLRQVLRTSKRIPVRELLDIREYPADMQDVLTLYAEGYAMSDFLVRLGGKREFIAFLDTAHEHGWPAAFDKHYQIRDLGLLDDAMLMWMEHQEQFLAAEPYRRKE